MEQVPIDFRPVEVQKLDPAVSGPEPYPGVPPKATPGIGPFASRIDARDPDRMGAAARSRRRTTRATRSAADATVTNATTIPLMSVRRLILLMGRLISSVAGSKDGTATTRIGNPLSLG